MRLRWLNRRLITRAFICLLLGAILNVAVAWGCVWWALPASRAAGPQHRASWAGSVPAGWIAPTSPLWIETSAGLTEYRLHTISPSERYPVIAYVQHVLEAGLPFRSMFVERHYEENAGVTYSGFMLGSLSGERRGLIPEWIPGTRYSRASRLLPGSIMWIGFAANSVLYGFLSGVIFGLLLGWHRRRRVRRNECAACGYPIGTSPVCTECGAPLPTSATQ